jgi:hypothetical protein
MGGKIILLLLLILPVNVTALDNSSSAFFGDSSGTCQISLEGNDMILMPKMSFPEGAGGMERFDRIPVYSINQSIAGAFFFPLQTDISNLSVCITAFDLLFYLSDYRGAGFSGKECAKNILALDGSNYTIAANDLEGTNGKSFLLSSTSSGLHSLNLFDEKKSSLLISMPLLITEGQTVLQVPSIVEAKEPFIQVVMNTTVPGNQSKFFAAILVSRDNYESARIGIANNMSINSFDITLSLGSKSLQIEGPPKISSELLMGLLPLLPANSAIGLQESTQQSIDLILLPDQSWEKGEYILTGGIYSPGKGLLGIKQSEVLIV